MKEKWNVYRDKINAMKRRERVLLLFSVIAICYLLWDGLFLRPVLLEKKQIQGQIANLQQQTSKLEQEQSIIQQSLTLDPDAKSKQEMENLRRQLRDLDEELSELEVGLVPVTALPQILQDVLQRISGLRLQGMETLPMQELQLSTGHLSTEEFEGGGESAAGSATGSAALNNSSLSLSDPDEADLGSDLNDAESDNTGVFKHTVVLSLKGSYFRTLKYLAALEELPWRFYWDQLTYTVERYPQGEIEVRIYTLSIEKGLLGV